MSIKGSDFLNTMQDFNELEIKKKIFGRGRGLQADKVEALEREIDDAEANAFEAGALVRRDQAQDESVYYVQLRIDDSDIVTAD